MTDRNEILERLIEAARLLGITQAKKGYGIYTIADGKVEGALYESIDTLRQALAQPGQVVRGGPALYTTINQESKHD